MIWIVDADAKQVAVWTPDANSPTVETERISWRLDAAAEPLVVVEPSELFAAL